MAPGVYFRMLLLGYFGVETHNAVFRWFVKVLDEEPLRDGGMGADSSWGAS
jgi:hypothetical protein